MAIYGKPFEEYHAAIAYGEVLSLAESRSFNVDEVAKVKKILTAAVDKLIEHQEENENVSKTGDIPVIHECSETRENLIDDINSIRYNAYFWRDVLHTQAVELKRQSALVDAQVKATIRRFERTRLEIEQKYDFVTS